MKSSEKLQPRLSREPWHTVSTDLVDPLHQTTSGNTCIAVCQHKLIKATAVTVGKTFYQRILRFVCPAILISDNGVQYKNRDIRKFL